MNDIPQPKYKIGDVLYLATIKSVSKQHDCPDCLGSKEWKIVTPAGSELTISCARCVDNHSREIPPLSYQAWEPDVRPMTIKSIEARAGCTSRAITYYDSTGCCGTTVSEDNAIDTREAAQVVAQIKAAEANERESAKAVRVESGRLARLYWKEAGIAKAREDVFTAWGAYRFLSEDVQEVLSEDNHESEREKIESLRDKVDWDLRHRTIGKEFASSLEAIFTRARREFPDAMFAGLPDILVADIDQLTESRTALSTAKGA